jgi:hypothetical protein
MYAMLRGRRYIIIFILKVHASTDDKFDERNAIFYEELEQAFDQVPKYDLKIL